METSENFRQTPSFLIPYLEEVEGQKSAAYKDSRGRWTIGVGHTGPEVHEGLIWSQDQINQALESDLVTAKSRLYQAIGANIIGHLTDYQYAALLSFVFNVGSIDTWAIWGDLRDGRLSDVPKQMRRFVYSNGVVIKGLINRRDNDVSLWLGSHPLITGKEEPK